MIDGRDDAGDFSSRADHLAASDTRSAAPPLTRGGALAQVVLCSGFPTQIVLTQILLGLGLLPFDAHGQLTTAYVTTLTLVDSVMLIALILWLLARHEERPADVFVGARSVAREAAVGVLLIPVAGALVVAVLSGLRALVPWLHNVPRNPLEALIQSPADAVLLGVVAVIGGGLREELQRAFILHRFRQRLGGATVGLIVFSTAFGAGHLVQGMDVAVTTAVLGFFWGAVYVRRGSIMAPVVCHAGFNAAEIIRQVAVGSSETALMIW